MDHNLNDLDLVSHPYTHQNICYQFNKSLIKIIKRLGGSYIPSRQTRCINGCELHLEKLKSVRPPINHHRVIRKLNIKRLQNIIT